MRYLGVDPATDENILWIFTAFKEEPLPPYSSQYVKARVKECRYLWDMEFAL